MHDRPEPTTSRPVVLCTLPLHESALPLLTPVADVRVASSPHADSLREQLGEADYLVVRTHLPSDLLHQPHRLKAIVRHGTGLDMIPMESATQQGIPVANVPGANAQAVTEYVVGALLALARRFGDLDHGLRHGGWTTARAHAQNAFELTGKTLGVVGLGDIGCRVAQACHAGFGMRVLGYQPQPGDAPAHVQRVGLEELLASSDFVSLHCPLTPQTRHLIDARRLASMKPGAFLINAARGEVVDEAALAQALRARTLRGAALDVFAAQPLANDHPFLQLDNVLLTPHVAALTEESTQRMSQGTAEQLLQLIRGERPRFLVNPEVWAAWPHRVPNAS